MYYNGYHIIIYNRNVNLVVLKHDRNKMCKKKQNK